MSNEMPSPDELEKIQKANLTEEQIAKDEIREDAFSAGKMAERKQEADIRGSAAERKAEDIGKQVKEQNIERGDIVEIIYWDDVDNRFDWGNAKFESMLDGGDSVFFYGYKEGKYDQGSLRNVSKIRTIKLKQKSK